MSASAPRAGTVSSYVNRHVVATLLLPFCPAPHSTRWESGEQGRKAAASGDVCVRTWRLFVSCFVLGLFSVRAVSLSLCLAMPSPVLPFVIQSVYLSVYLSPSYVDVARRQSGLLTLLSVSLAHLLGLLF